MRKAIGLRLGLALGVLLATIAPTRAETIFQSALLPPNFPIGDPPVSGGSIDPDVFVGVRFTTAQDLIITGLGMRASVTEGLGNELLFLALTPLSSPSAFPSSPTLSDAIFHSLFAPPKWINGNRVGSADGMVSTHFLLPAGNYALIGGSGLFGATGSGGFTSTNVDIGYEGQFFWSVFNNAHQDNGFSNSFREWPARFFVEGHAVPTAVPASTPEPGTLALLATGGLPLLGFWRQRRAETARTA
jgi:hypothetical protein